MKDQGPRDGARKTGESLAPTFVPLDPPRAAVDRLLQTSREAAAASDRPFRPRRWLLAVAVLLAAALIFPWMLNRNTDPAPDEELPSAFEITNHRGLIVVTHRDQTFALLAGGQR